MKFTNAQNEAITYPPGNLQLIASAGSGKTEVVAQRILPWIAVDDAKGMFFG